MKFQRYCLQSDIDLENSNCRHLGKNSTHGFVVDEKVVYLYVNGTVNFYCVFTNDDNIELTDNFLLKWADNISAFIKETVGVVINPSLTLQVPEILRNLKSFENGIMYNGNSLSLFTVKKNPVVELKRDDLSYFITLNDEPLYNVGINNKKLAEDIFNNIASDISLYIKKRWPIK